MTSDWSSAYRGGFGTVNTTKIFAKHRLYKMARCIRGILVLILSLLTKVIYEAEVFVYFSDKIEVVLCSILDFLEYIPVM